MVGSLSAWGSSSALVAAAGVVESVLLNLMGSMMVTVLYVGLAGLFGWVAYLLLTLPLRRRERARLFLSLVETGLREGASAETTVVGLSRQGVGVLGTSLHAVAREVEAGATLAAALGHEPGLLPPRIVEMLAAGERAGDLARVLPACRQTLGDARARVRSATHYLILIALGVGGIFFATLVVFPGIGVYIVPRFREMWADMRIEPPPLLALMMDASRSPAFYAVLWLIPMGLAAGGVCYVAGPWLARALGLQGLESWVQRVLPWRWKRVQRDFSAMLGVLLDAGMPEADAVVFAARSTANTLLMRRADLVADALEAGMPLTEAVGRLDGSGEFLWRLGNAAHAGTGFAEALAGWHESLDARAFHQEQVAAQIVTSAIVLLNGAVVAAFVIGVFQMFVHLMGAVAIW